MGKFVTYFTDQNVPVTSTYFLIVVGFAAFCLLVGLFTPVFVYIMKRRKAQSVVRHQRIIASLAGVARTIGLLELLVLALRYESISPFTNRIWMWAIGLVGVVWAGWLIQSYRKVVPQYHKEDVLQDRYHKYLPKPKRRRAS